MMLAPFATLGALASRMRRSVDTISALDALDEASAVVRTYCGWHIWPEHAGDEVIVDGPGGCLLMLPSLHVTDVAAVVNDGQAVTDFEWSAMGAIEWSAGWTCKRRGVAVTFTHGYAELPLEVRSVVLGIASRSLISPAGITREQVGQVSISFSATGAGTAGGIALIEPERWILDRYRLPATV